jgi:hypothetical protein
MTTQASPPPLVTRLRQAVVESGRPSDALAAACGIDPGRLDRFLRGADDLSLADAGRLCATLGLELARRQGTADEQAARLLEKAAVPAAPPATPAPPPAAALEDTARTEARPAR